MMTMKTTAATPSTFCLLVGAPWRTNCPSVQFLRGPCCRAPRIWLSLGPAALLHLLCSWEDQQHQRQSPLGPTWRNMLCRPSAQTASKVCAFFYNIFILLNEFKNKNFFLSPIKIFKYYLQIKNYSPNLWFLFVLSNDHSFFKSNYFPKLQ